LTSGDFDDFAMIERAGVGENGLRVGLREQIVEVRIVEGGVEAEFAGVAFEEASVRLGDAYDLQIGAVEILAEKAFGVAVTKSGDHAAERRRILLRDKN